MNSEETKEFLRRSHRAVLSTRRSDGRPQMSPIVFGVDDQGRVLISTRAATAKAKNVRRAPQVSLCVLNDGFFGDWVQVDGQASLVELPAALELLRFVYRSVSGEHPDWDEFDRDMIAQERVVIVIDPVRE